MILRDPNNERVEVIFTSARTQSVYLQHLSNCCLQAAPDPTLQRNDIILIHFLLSKITHVRKYATITRRERFPTVQGMHGDGKVTKDKM